MVQKASWSIVVPLSLLKGHLGLPWETYQQAVRNEFLGMAGCAFGTDVCHWMFKKTVNMVQGQQDGPLNMFC